VILKLGIDAYSIRALGWKATQLIDYAAEMKVDMIQPALNAFESLEDAYLRKLKEHADRLGIWVEPGFGCICPLSKGYGAKQGDPAEYLRTCVRVAKALGSPSFKVFMGNANDRSGGTPIPKMMEAAIRVLKSVRTHALDAGVKIAIENHGDLLAWQAKTVIEEAGKDFVGSCLDSGNPVVVLEDPLMALETLGPYVITSHIRDSVVYEHPRGAAVQWVALGDGSIDMKAFAVSFRELCPGAPFQLEILTGAPPRVLPYLEPDFWRVFPDARAPEFARFVKLVKTGRPFMGNMVIGGPGKQPPEYTAALRQQQRVDLERSLEYAKKTLDIGVKWRAADQARRE
jgi:sugar phosphate isomerase/epimerase